MTDSYRDWDAAYLLGSLAPAERREFEGHLSECAECSASVAELAALPGLLARVPASEVESPEVLPREFLPHLVAAARRHRARVRALTTGLLLAGAAAAVAVALVVPGLVSVLLPGRQGERVAEITLGQVVPSALSADVRLIAHDWGTSVEMTCRYAGDYSAPDVAAVTYGLYVTDSSGGTTQLATWTALPGRTVAASGATNLPIDEIRTVDVRAVESGTVLLAGSP